MADKIDSPESQNNGEFNRSSPDSYIENRSPSNPDLDELGISEQEFSMISTKAFNKLLKEKKISKEVKKRIKKERRTLKNRGYAATSRVKKDNEEKRYEKANEELKRQISQIRKAKEEALLKNQLLKARYKQLYDIHKDKLLKKENEEHEKNEKPICEVGKECDELDRGLHMKDLLANRKEINWEIVKED